jgi:hypothetical protein
MPGHALKLQEGSHFGPVPAPGFDHQVKGSAEEIARGSGNSDLLSALDGLHQEHELCCWRIRPLIYMSIAETARQTSGDWFYKLERLYP